MRRFAEALESSAERARAGPEAGALERYLGALHLEDLALACACAAGDESAWEHFILEQRPFLYRAANALDPAAARATWRIRCTRSSSGSGTGRASGSRCSAIFMDAAA